MNKHVKNILNVAFMIVLFILTIYVIFSNNDIEDVFTQIKEGSIIVLVIAMGMMLISTLCESVIIYIILKSYKEKVSFLRCAKYSFIGFYYCAITPSASGGQPAQIFYMKKDGYKLTTSTIIIMTIVTVYKLVLIGFVGFVMIFNIGFLNDNIGSLKFFFGLGVILNTIFIIFVIMMFVMPSILDYLLKGLLNACCKIRLMCNHDGKLKKLSDTMNDYIAGTNYIKQNWKLLIPVTVLTIVQRLLLFSIAYVIYRYFGLTQYSFMDILTLSVILSTSVDVLPVPGGIGASELAFKILFEKVYIKVMLVPAMLVTRFVNFYFMLILSAIISLAAHFLMIRNEFRKEDFS